MFCTFHYNIFYSWAVHFTKVINDLNVLIIKKKPKRYYKNAEYKDNYFIHCYSFQKNTYYCYVCIQSFISKESDENHLH